jgi:UDP:flavonoid glycosyltransferase YjiC (YdhE family)
VTIELAHHSSLLFSHMEKVTTISEGLIKLGYPVYFLAGPDFKDYLESIGATYVPIEGIGSGMMPPDKLATFVSLRGHEADVFAINTVFTDTIPAQHRTLQRTFSQVREEYGQDQPLIYINDCAFAGITPVFLGAPGIRPTAAISIAVAPYSAASNDTFPFQTGLYPDTSPDSKKIHFKAQQERYNTYPDSEWNTNLRNVLAAMGTTRDFPSLFDMFASASDVLLQYGIPEFEYPRSDWRPNVKFVGAPVAVGIADRELPEWWNEVVQAKKDGKKIVAVTSSSVVFDNNALIIPALEALKDREDVLVIATLVTSDVEQMDFKIPANARVAKFIPIDLALPFVRCPIIAR